MSQYPDNLPFAVFAAETEGRLRYRLPLVTYTNRFTPVAETIWMSPQVEALTGYTPTEWIETPGFFGSILHPEDRQRVLEEVRLSRADLRPFSLDYRLIARSGDTVWIHDESVPVLDSRGRPEFIQGYFVDLTERKALEQHLVHAQKMEALGRMAAGIAHDFNNHLAAIGGYADLISFELPVDGKSQDYLGEIVQTTARAGRLVEQLLAFCRHEPIEPQWTSVSSVVDELRSMLSQIAGPEVTLSFELAADEVVFIDPGQLEQVVVNLVANARDAMPEGGVVGVATRTASVSRLESTRLGVDPGSYVVLSISDTGSGIDAETLKQIFEPFFTTKKRIGGTGLGLATVFAIVRTTGGTVDVASTPGTGTTFSVLMPAAARR